MHDKPIEIFCPICGYATPVNEDNPELEGLSREEKVIKIRKLQKGEKPVFTCSGCDNPEASADIMEVR